MGTNGLEHSEDWESLTKIAVKYLSCNSKPENTTNNKDIDMDYKQDEKYIKVSFLTEYNIDLSKVSLHWWDFFDMLNGLSENAVLSRVRYIRNFDINTIKDRKEKEKMIKQKKQVQLEIEKVKPTLEQQKNAERFYELIGLRKE